MILMTTTLQMVPNEEICINKEISWVSSRQVYQVPVESVRYSLIKQWNLKLSIFDRDVMNLKKWKCESSFDLALSVLSCFEKFIVNETGVFL